MSYLDVECVLPVTNKHLRPTYITVPNQLCSLLRPLFRTEIVKDLSSGMYLFMLKTLKNFITFIMERVTQQNFLFITLPFTDPVS